MKVVWLMMFGAWSSAAWANTHLVGKVYEKGSNLRKLLFLWERQLTEEGDKQHALVVFRTPEGEELTREEVWYEKGQFKKYTLRKFQNGEDAKVEVVGNKIEMAFKEGDNAPKSDSEDYDPSEIIIVDQIGQFIRKNWDKIAKGDSVKVRYVVPQRTESVSFKFFKDGEAQCDGTKATIIKMKPSSFLIAAFVDPLYFTFSDAGNHRLCEYTGRTTPMKKDGNSWETLDAHTLYDAPAPGSL